ncbi:MAG: GGDEF domain-containing protein [Spirochaetaceae bacterium]|jgi:diguanylate cyclase (GGDEF)-like protein|nr:GGDEF domain-containing protein [Spirochaetaceae bacterium]
MAKLLKQPFSTEDELCLYLISYTILIFFAVIHSFFLIAYLLQGVLFFVLLNGGSLLVSLVVWLCLSKKCYQVGGFLIALEVNLYAGISAYVCGIGSYILGYFLLIILMLTLFPYGSTRFRRVMVLLILGVIAFLGVRAAHAVPLIILAEPFGHSMTLVNLSIMLLGTLLEIAVNTLVQRIIFRIREGRLMELSSQIYTDPLTGLFNRRYQDIYLKTLKNPDQPVCVAILDIDDFKRINDTYGHPCGDEILIFLSDFLKNNLRKTDKIFRWGGEEFLIIMEQVTLANAKAVMDKLRAKLAEAEIITKQKGTLGITITVGVAPFDWANPEASIEASDKKLYIGKRRGKNQVV